MIGMCEVTALDKCLYLMIRMNLTLFAFWGDDCPGHTIVKTNQWHHFAFVYDYPNSTQFVYLNGVLECKRTPRGPFLGNAGSLIIGAIVVSNVSLSPHNYWTGYIDQVSYVSRAKTEKEILRDATLVAYFSFDNGLFHDSGPNAINGVSEKMKDKRFEL